jgi:hypothetical protein
MREFLGKDIKKWLGIFSGYNDSGNLTGYLIIAIAFGTGCRYHEKQLQDMFCRIEPGCCM